MQEGVRRVGRGGGGGAAGQAGGTSAGGCRAHQQAAVDAEIFECGCGGGGGCGGWRGSGLRGGGSWRRRHPGSPSCFILDMSNMSMLLQPRGAETPEHSAK